MNNRSPQSTSFHKNKFNSLTRASRRLIRKFNIGQIESSPSEKQDTPNIKMIRRKSTSMGELIKLENPCNLLNKEDFGFSNTSLFTKSIQNQKSNKYLKGIEEIQERNSPNSQLPTKQRYDCLSKYSLPRTLDYRKYKPTFMNTSSQSFYNDDSKNKLNEEFLPHSLQSLRKKSTKNLSSYDLKEKKKIITEEAHNNRSRITYYQTKSEKVYEGLNPYSKTYSANKNEDLKILNTTKYEDIQRSLIEYTQRVMEERMSRLKVDDQKINHQENPGLTESLPTVKSEHLIKRVDVPPNDDSWNPRQTTRKHIILRYYQPAFINHQTHYPPYVVGYSQPPYNMKLAYPYDPEKGTFV